MPEFWQFLTVNGLGLLMAITAACFMAIGCS
jgi:hypothetical protein